MQQNVRHIVVAVQRTTCIRQRKCNESYFDGGKKSFAASTAIVSQFVGFTCVSHQSRTEKEKRQDGVIRPSRILFHGQRIRNSESVATDHCANKTRSSGNLSLMDLRSTTSTSAELKSGIMTERTRERSERRANDRKRCEMRLFSNDRSVSLLADVVAFNWRQTRTNGRLKEAPRQRRLWMKTDVGFCGHLIGSLKSIVPLASACIQLCRLVL